MALEVDLAVADTLGLADVITTADGLALGEGSEHKSRLAAPEQLNPALDDRQARVPSKLQTVRPD